MSDWEKDEKRGEWNLHVYKSRPSRWNFFLKNPQGGGGGSSSYTSMRAAIAAGLRANLEGADKVWVLIKKWNAERGDYDVVKSYWHKVAQASMRKQVIAELLKAKRPDLARHYRLATASMGDQIKAGRRDIASKLTTGDLTPAQENSLAALRGRIAALEKLHRESAAALKKFESNPQKYRPQLDNIWSSFKGAYGLGRAGMRITDELRKS